MRTQLLSINSARWPKPQSLNLTLLNMGFKQVAVGAERLQTDARVSFPDFARFSSAVYTKHQLTEQQKSSPGRCTGRNAEETEGGSSLSRRLGCKLLSFDLAA